MLRIHFLNVGHGDCTVIRHPSGRLTMIDINNSQSYDDYTRGELIEQELRKSQSAILSAAMRNSLATPFSTTPKWGLVQQIEAQATVDAGAKRDLTDPIAFMRTTYPGERLWRFVLTHPDLDHMRGLQRLYDEIGFDNFWDTANNKTISSFRSDADRTDWNFYQQLRASGIQKVYQRGASEFAFGKDSNGLPGGDNIEILSPTREIAGACNTNGTFNDISLVIRIHHGGRSVMLPGDVEKLAWDSMVYQYGDALKSDFLKASHHGRDSGYDLAAIRLISPNMVFVSVGQKPATDASSKYRQFAERVASTRYYGDIELQINDNGSWQWLVMRNAER